MQSSSTPHPPGPGHREGIDLAISTRQVWRAGWVLVAVVAFASLLNWVMRDAGNVLFTLIFSFLGSVAMEPAVRALSRHMRRPVASLLVLIGLFLSIVLFIVMFGRLLGEQIVAFAQTIPSLAANLVTWVNNRFDTQLSYEQILANLGLGPEALADLARNFAGGLLGFLAQVASAAFGTLTFAFFTYYFSADAPRLRRWIAALFPPKHQEIVNTVWDLTFLKTGGYVSARLVLALICGGTASLFMLVIGMPYWLPLGIWTGIVAQFVPTIGTYVAIALPVLIGLIGEKPWQGLAVLGFALVYQQIENVTIEPKISAEAVDVHPAVSFAAVMFGASLFGVGGAFVAVPVGALLLALFEIYSRKYEVLPAPGLARVDDDATAPEPSG